MEQVIWIEVLASPTQVEARYRLNNSVCYLGRGYDNDVVIDDPFIAARHIRIERGSDGALVATDMDTTNGIFIGQSRLRQKTITLNGDTVIRIGRTMLRVRESHYAVPVELIARPQTNLWLSLFLPVMYLIGLTELFIWLNAIKASKPLDYIIALIGLVVLTFFWTVFWAVMSRLFSERANFIRHLCTAVWMMLAFSISGEVLEMLAFALSSPLLNQFGNLIEIGILGIFCFFHLRIIGRSRLYWKAGAIIGLYLGIVGIMYTQMWSDPKILDKDDYITRIEPRIMRLVSPQNATDFWSDVDDLKNQLDVERKKAPPADDAQGRGLFR